MAREHRGLTVRLRLSALYGSLFLVSGLAMLVFIYILVARHLPTGTFYAGKVTATPGPVRAILSQPLRGAKAVGALPGPGGFAIIGKGPLAAYAGAVPASGFSAPQAVFSQIEHVSNTQRSTALNDLLLDSAIALAVMFVISSVLGWLVAGRSLRPVQAMADAARDISERNLHSRLPEAGPRDELRHLASTFNAMLGRLEEAFESQRRFVANASHELRTPLTLERTLVEVALSDPDADIGTLRAAAERVLAIGREQETLIDALITLARGQRGLEESTPVDLAATTEAAIDAARTGAGTISLEPDLSPAVVAGDARLVESLVTNLVENGVEHNYQGGWVRVSTATVDDRVELRVSNSGPVVPPSDVERLLQPFQRSGPERVGREGGLGLGLSIVSAIATAHGAELTVAARPEGGMDVVVAFPGRTTPGA